MSFRYLNFIRKLNTTSTLRKSLLSSEYKSKKLWEERFSCNLLSFDESVIKTINNKIVLGSDLNNLEIDIFVNIATPQIDETAQLQESARLLAAFRKSLYAHTLLNSTPHALCRLFLDSQQLESLVRILEDRVKYGVFPDNYALNLMLNESLDKEAYQLAARLATFVMLQEEFGLNHITDNLSLFGLAKYIESKTDFSDWIASIEERDLILTPETEAVEATNVEEKQEKKEVDDDEEEDDAEYIRIPFLRNPYFDNHFDIKNPRILCGRSLSRLAKLWTENEPELAVKVKFLGSILEGNWSDAIKLLGESSATLDANLRGLAKFYIDNLHNINEPDAELKTKLLTGLGTTFGDEPALSRLAEVKCSNLVESEKKDIEVLRRNFNEWSEQRHQVKARQEKLIARKELIAEIKAKKEELKLKEQYLYFYDNLKKSRVTRIEYN